MSSAILDRAHDVLTDSCDDHVIWWPRRGLTEWIQNLCTVVMTHNDLCTCIALTKWDGPVAENVENFPCKCYNFTAAKTSDNISKATWTWQSYPLHIFCWFQRNKDDITIVAQHVRDLFTTAAEERLKCLGYLESWIFEYEFRDIFLQDSWHTRQALTKWHIKVPKANSRWYVEYVQLV